MQETTSFAQPIEGSRPNPFSHTYSGKFKDLNPDLRAAGILTYAPGENVDSTLRQNLNIASDNIPLNLQRYRHYNSPDVGEIRLHYGHAFDPKHYNNMTHGVQTDRELTSKDILNPKVESRFNHLKGQLNERYYNSHKSAPLGRVPNKNLPKHIDPYTSAFGKTSNKCDSAKECINPDKPRFLVELESSDKHEMYVFSHKDYEPGEQKDRLFTDSFDRYKRFGLTEPVFHDGRLTKESLNWLPNKLLEKRLQTDSNLLDNFREKHAPQIGKVLDPNKDTRFLGPDHVFGLTNTGDHLSAGDIIHYRQENKIMKGKDRERAYSAVLRSHLARYNLVKFKTLVEAFKFYDKNKDGFICKDELNFVCSHSGFPATDELLNLLIKDCDHDNDGKINFLEFVNFLCFKDSMKIGIDYKPSNDPNRNEDIKDDEGRFLLKEKDLVHQNNILANDLVPRTIVNQIDEKSGKWKSTYDLINEAPFRAEPLIKRVYGVPSIRNDLPAPEFKKIQDRKNYGTDGNVWSLINPSIFSKYGVHEKDMLKPRSKSEIKQILTNVGYKFSDEQFETTWDKARSLNPYGEVSIDEFRTVWEQSQNLNNNQNKPISCS